MFFWVEFVCEYFQRGSLERSLCWLIIGLCCLIRLFPEQYFQRASPDDEWAPFEKKMLDYRALPIYLRCCFVIIGHLGMDLFRIIQMVTEACQWKLYAFLAANGVDEHAVARMYTCVEVYCFHQIHAAIYTTIFIFCAPVIVWNCSGINLLIGNVIEIIWAKVIGHVMLSELYNAHLKHAREPCFLSFFVSAVVFVALIHADFVPDMPILLAFLFVRHGIRK